jgi:hypothetical protein
MGAGADGFVTDAERFAAGAWLTRGVGEPENNGDAAA